MKKAIKQKLINLVAINHSDPIIQCNLGAKNIDLLKLIPQEDLIMFINGELSVIEFNVNTYLSDIDKQLRQTSSYSEFCDVLAKNKLDLTSFRKDLLMNNFAENKPKVIVNVLEKIQAFVKKLLSLNKLAKNYYDDTNVSPLYIATNYLVGLTSAHYSFKSPLCLYRVSITQEGSKLIISKLQEDLVLNEKLLVYLKKEFNDNKTNIADLLSISDYSEILDSIQKITEKQIVLPTPETLVDFQQFDWDNIHLQNDNFYVEPSVVIGIYEPDGGLLKEDLKWLIENEIDPFEKKEDKDKANEYYIEKVIKDQPIIEIGNPLNIYQKYAIASALHQNTLIYGPPGTGKSEIIANLIFNILLKGKTSLLVSEKKAALNVLTERINSLSKFALFIYDLKNKDAFYAKIDELNQLLGPQWYREKSKASKNVKMEPIIFTPEESMFLKNYHDWYNELSSILKQHWNIEDYLDGIYKLDYAEYVKTKNKLGKQITQEWLRPLDDTKVTLYDEVTEIFSQYNFCKIEDLFESYTKFVKFVKKFNLKEVFKDQSIHQSLDKIIKKINANLSVVESYLSNQKKDNQIIESYKAFLDKYNYDESPYNEIFFNRSFKDKKTFIEKAESFVEFYDNVIAKDYTLNSKTTAELKTISDEFQSFYTKYAKLLDKFDWFNFLIPNKDKLFRFLSDYNTLSPEKKKIYFAEFVENGTLLPLDDMEDYSSLSMKQISLLSKEATEIIGMFNTFVDNTQYFAKPRLFEIINHQEFLDYNINFLKDLISNKPAYTSEIQEIYREWSWLSMPFLKTLYLDNFVLFDLNKVEPVMKKVNTEITMEQYKDLKIVMFWEKIIKFNGMFNETKGRFLQDIIVQLRKESKRSAEIVEEITFKRYIQNLRVYLSKLPQDEKDEIAKVFKLASAKNNLPAPVKFIKHFYPALKRLFPIWVGRPDNVATVIPLNASEFDYGIFDEASQMPIERAYPLVYRCDKKVVAGDDKQLKPTSFFTTKLDNSEYDIDDFDSAESLLERAKTSWWNEYQLKNHYRSWSKSLMEFSNKYIYNNTLEIASKSDYLTSAIDVIDVNGTWTGENLAEAKKVVELLIENYDKYQKILIITFNSKQSQVIENLLSEQSRTLPDALKDKLETDQIMISNLENVQGNEGDLVILSVAYGKNAEGILRNNFGPLNAHGGLNRLNVAITRAKQKMIIVKSLMGYEIKVSNQDNQNALIFKKFIEFADNFQHELSTDQEITNMENQALVDFESDTLKEIYGELMIKLPSKYQILGNLNIGTKKLDFAIINRATKEIVKGIIVERWKENRTLQLMIEDIDRQYFLEERGYSIFRIKEYEWYTEKHKVIANLLESLNKNTKNNINYVIRNNN